MSKDFQKQFPELVPFTEAVRNAYREKLAGLYLFGSRARGDHRPDSDYDVAIVLRDIDDFWREQVRLADLAYESMLQDGVYIQPFPFSKDEWEAEKQQDLVGSAQKIALELAL